MFVPHQQVLYCPNKTPSVNTGTSMENWLAILIVIIVVFVVIGDLSILKKSSTQKMREKSLNDRTETLPRSNRSAHKMPPLDKTKSQRK